jgi:hypothetical protein
MIGAARIVILLAVFDSNSENLYQFYLISYCLLLHHFFYFTVVTAVDSARGRLHGLCLCLRSFEEKETAATKSTTKR